MKTSSLTLCLITLSFILRSQSIPDAKTQIKQAVMAAPESFKKEAMVYGYDQSGNFTILREGSNDLICLADDPNKEGFSVAAYFKELDEFMARGRTLKAEGKSFREIFNIREDEVKAGQLKMPDKSTLYVLSGEFDPEGNPVNTYLRYVFYIPFATSESTGLPTSPASPGGPWIMDPGTHRAHIMISPPRN